MLPCLLEERRRRLEENGSEALVVVAGSLLEIASELRWRP